MIDGYTRVCGLIGNPVEHTKSPVIHNNLADNTGVNLVYVPFHVETGKVGQAIEGAYALNLLGLNVTVPYKNDCIAFLKDIDPLAEKIGAVNTLVRIDGGYKGYNTDMPGLYRAMVSDGVDFCGKKVVIIGAGGVARAVAVMLAEKDVAQIIIANRTVEKAKAIADEVNGFYDNNVVSVSSLYELKNLPGGNYLAIQATNVGMYPNVDEVVVDDDAFYEKVALGYDLVYNPEETTFMKKLRAKNKPAFNGAKMLLYQGIIAYELWTGKSISDDLAEKVYELMK